MKGEPEGSGRRQLPAKIPGAGEGDHPSPEHLEAFHWGDLEPEETDRLRLHLALCVDCREQLRFLDEMDSNLAHPSSEAPPAEVERALARFRLKPLACAPTRPAESLAETVGGSFLGEASPPKGAGRPFPRWSLARGPYAVAASLLIAVLGLLSIFTTRLAQEEERLRQSEKELGASKARQDVLSKQLEEIRGSSSHRDREIAALRKEREELLAPQPNTPILDLRLDRNRGPGGAPVAELPLNGASRFVTLVLEDPGKGRDSNLRALFSDSADRPLFAVEELRPSAYGNFVITLNQAALPVGTTKLRLAARRGTSWVEVARYSLLRRR